jgi:hypothetical protein
LLLAASFGLAQQKPKSHEECLKLVPGDWGPKFGAQWHQKEAVYWACRNGVSISTAKAWQKAADESDMASEITPVTVKGQKLVLFVEDSGTANCYSLTVLLQVGSAWKIAWALPPSEEEGEYCVGDCPGLEAAMNGEILTVRYGVSSDPNDDRCKHFRWVSQRFRWNRSTFIPVD